MGLDMGVTSSLDYICAPAWLAPKFQPSAKYLLKASPQGGQQPQGRLPSTLCFSRGSPSDWETRYKCWKGTEPLPPPPRPHLQANNRPAGAPLSLFPSLSMGTRSMSLAKRGLQGRLVIALRCPDNSAFWWENLQ